jgi:hypothetical protein
MSVVASSFDFTTSDVRDESRTRNGDGSGNRDSDAKVTPACFHAKLWWYTWAFRLPAGFVV